jgi:hypothetical protein
MTLADISTDMLIELRERILSGRTQISAFEKGPRAAAFAAECERRVIEAVQNELLRRLN